MLARPAIGPRLPEPIAFITSAMVRCILSMRLTSSTLVPEPAAMRFLRLALSRSGFLRSCGVIESMIATWRLSTRSSRFADASWFFIFAMPGSMPISPLMPPICCICMSCSRRSARSNAPLRIFSATRAAFSASIVAAAFSTRVMMSPMPRMRSAMRAGWKSSSASIFSPVPMSLIGLPVTARMESAAPPRPSPSTRVSTMPVSPTRSSKARARLTASWPVSASATSSTSCGSAARLTSAASAIIASSSVVRPAVSRMTTS